MKKIAIFLRNNLKINRFSDAVLGSLKSLDVDSAILCSGFFQEDTSYSVSTAKFNLSVRSTYPLNLDVFGYYGHRRGVFLTFLRNVRHINGLPGFLSLSGYRIPGDKWHAKVCIAKKNNFPIFAAIGSSNITRRAFDNWKDFNYECDVIFWDESIKTINDIMSDILEGNPDLFPSIVVADYDNIHPANAYPLVDRLKDLEQEIRVNSVKIF